MAVAPASKRLTAAEFEATHCGVPLCELQRGEVIRLSPGGLSHGKSCMCAAFVLEEWARRSGLGRVFVNEIGVITQQNPDTVRGADVVYVSYTRIPREQEPEGFCPVPPELVVEVIGKGQGWKKLVEKAGEYLNMGVDRVWVLDGKARSVHVFRSDAEPVRLVGDDVISDEDILPGFSCAAAQLFERK